MNLPTCLYRNAFSVGLSRLLIGCHKVQTAHIMFLFFVGTGLGLAEVRSQTVSVKALEFRKKGDIRDKAGDHVGALSFFEKAAENSPGDAMSYIRIVDSAKKLRRPETGLAAISNLMNLDPAWKQTEWVNLARNDFVIEASRMMNHLSPQNALALRAAQKCIADSRSALGRKENESAKRFAEEGRKFIRPALMDPRESNLEIWIAAGRIATILEDDELSGFAYEAIERLRPDFNLDDELLDLMAELYRRNAAESSGQIRAARSALEDWLNESEIGTTGIEAELTKEGVLIRSFSKWTNTSGLESFEAKKLGPGDRIIEFNGLTVTNTESFHDAERLSTVGRSVPITISHGTNSQTIGVDIEPQSVRIFENIGDYYREGNGVLKDESEAFKWYSKGVSHGSVEAQYKIGRAYYLGSGIAKDAKLAAAFWKNASDRGHALAQYNLGVLYSSGEGGLARDSTNAVRLFRLAADQGLPSAQFNLGVHLITGNGVADDWEEGLRWYTKAAERGYLDAQRGLGVFYRNGIYGKNDKKLSAFWFRKAAEQGDAMAQRSLGEIYENGVGTETNLTEAISWYQKASLQGETNAASALLRLGK